jgi:hypothetical protein
VSGGLGVLAGAPLPPSHDRREIIELTPIEPQRTSDDD